MTHNVCSNNAVTFGDQELWAELQSTFKLTESGAVGFAKRHGATTTDFPNFVSTRPYQQRERRGYACYSQRRRMIVVLPLELPPSTTPKLAYIARFYKTLHLLTHRILSTSPLECSVFANWSRQNASREGLSDRHVLHNVSTVD